MRRHMPIASVSRAGAKAPVARFMPAETTIRLFGQKPQPSLLDVES